MVISFLMMFRLWAFFFLKEEKKKKKKKRRLWAFCHPVDMTTNSGLKNGNP